MYEIDNKMNTNWGGGLVRQLGPWQPTAQDIFSFAAPRPYDPSDNEFLQPDGTPNVTNTRAQYVTEGGGKTIIKTPKTTTIINRVIDDPRVSAPGRRLSQSRILGARREPMEPMGEIVPLQSSLTIETPPAAAKEEEVIVEEEIFLPSKITVPPYTMPDTTPAPLMTQSQINQFNQMVADNESKSKGLIAQVMDPWKNIWANLSAEESKIARQAFNVFNKMTLEQQLRELNSRTSIIGALYRRVQIERGKIQKTVSDVLQTLADLAVFASFFL